MKRSFLESTLFRYCIVKSRMMRTDLCWIAFAKWTVTSLMLFVICTHWLHCQFHSSVRCLFSRLQRGIVNRDWILCNVCVCNTVHVHCTLYSIECTNHYRTRCHSKLFILFSVTISYCTAYNIRYHFSVSACSDIRKGCTYRRKHTCSASE